MAGFMVSGPLVLLGVLLLVEARNQKRRIDRGWVPHPKWWRRNVWYLLAVVPPLLILTGWSIHSLPKVLTRIDDGDRGARRIEGNGVTLIWAPEGPGWNWRQEFGGSPSWNRIALYGLPPVGMGDKPGYDSKTGVFASAEEMARYNLCLYLAQDGLTLETELQNIWGFVPGVHDPEQVLAICWVFVFGGGLGGLLVSLIAGFARDAGSTSV